jgi:hypothetical protein
VGASAGPAGFVCVLSAHTLGARASDGYTMTKKDQGEGEFSVAGDGPRRANGLDLVDGDAVGIWWVLGCREGGSPLSWSARRTEWLVMTARPQGKKGRPGVAEKSRVGSLMSDGPGITQRSGIPVASARPRANDAKAPSCSHRTHGLQGWGWNQGTSSFQRRGRERVRKGGRGGLQGAWEEGGPDDITHCAGKRAPLHWQLIHWILIIPATTKVRRTSDTSLSPVHGLAPETLVRLLFLFPFIFPNGACFSRAVYSAAARAYYPSPALIAR